MKKKFQIFAFILASVLVLPLAASALGQMSQPINITDAIRGQKINQELIVVNNENKQIWVEFTASGDIKDWVKFYLPTDLNNPLATTTAEEGKNLNMIAVFSIPNDIPNGEYKGFVSVSNMPDLYVAKDQSGSSVTQKIDRQVTIKISDQESVKLEVSVIPETYDLSQNQDLNVRIIYDNQSNISLSPSISFKIKTSNQDEKTVYNVIYPYPDSVAAVNSRGYFEIPALKIPTTGIVKGEYVAQLQFLRGDKVLIEKQFSFSIGTQGSAFATKITDLFDGKSGGLLALAALAIIIIIGMMVKRNLDIRKNFKLLKKKFIKGFKSVKTGIAGMF